MRKPLAFIFLCLIHFSCGYTYKYRKQLEKEWLGKNIHDITAKYGMPDYINIKDVPGTTIYIYVETDFTPDIPPNHISKDFWFKEDSVVYKVESFSW